MRKLVGYFLLDVVTSVALSFLKSVVRAGCIVTRGGIPASEGYVNVLLITIIADVAVTLCVRVTESIDFNARVKRTACTCVVCFEAGLVTSGLLTFVVYKSVTRSGNNLAFLMCASASGTLSYLLTIGSTGCGT